jgi:hypothetical protein
MSVPADGHGDAVVAALLQITQHAERLAVLDEREAAHYQETIARLTELGRLLTETTGGVDDVRATAARQSAILDSLDGLDQQVAALTSRLTDIAPADNTADQDGKRYRPSPAPLWWKLTGEEQQEAIGRLRAWVEQVYRPGYGHLAATLAPCWEQHPLCLYGLDWLMELWSVLHLTDERGATVLAGQAEWQTRLLPALAEQLHIETTRCQHARTTPPREPAAAERRPAHGTGTSRQRTAPR